MRKLLPLRSALGIPARSTVIALGLEAIAAAAQGLVAVSLGTLARFLGGGPKAAAVGVGMTWMSWLGGEVPTAKALGSATAVALVGLAAIAIRGTAWLVLEARETRDAAHIAANARRTLLATALCVVANGAVTLGTAITWPGELEIGARGERTRVRAWVHLAVLASVVLLLDATLAVLLLAMLAPFALLVRPIRSALRRAHASAARGSIETIDASRDVVEHAAVWATCGGGSLAVRRVDALSEEGAALATRAAMQRGLSSLSNELLAALAIVILVAAFAPSAPWPRPALVSVLIALVSTYRPIRDLAESSAAIDRGTRALDAMAALRPAVARAESSHRSFAAGCLAARGLAVDVGGRRARAGLDFDARPAAVVALVGPPGSGKSALLEAIAGVRPARGTLHFGDLSLEGAGVGPHERPVAWVPPSPPILPATLAENLAPDAPEDAARIERARAILRALGDETIVALPDDARIGPRGRALSSGECQRVALARALASDAPVLLLDEPTANLDADGEARAIAVIGEHARRRSVILVSHRPAPLALAAVVIEMIPRDDVPSGQGVVSAPESERRIA